MSTTFSPVISLFSHRRPSDVAGLIVTIVINSINRVFRGRASSERCEKSLKRSEPKFNASAAVSMKVFSLRILATISSIVKRSIFRRDFTAVPFAMRSVDQWFRFLCPATAGLHLLVGQTVGRGNVKSAAVAKAQPSPSATSFAIENAYNQKSVKSLTGQNLNAVSSLRRRIKVREINRLHMNIITRNTDELAAELEKRK